MNELTQAELLERVNTSRIADGNPRVREITARIVSDLFKTIDQFDVQPDEFWAAVDWFSRLGSSGQTGLITAGLGFDRLLDIREDEADRATGRAAGTPRAIEGPLYVPDAPLSRGEVHLDEGSAPRGEAFVMEGRVVDVNGKPLPEAMVEVWHADENGRYSHFAPGLSPFSLRRRILVDEQARYRFRSFLPPGYAIPPASPTSELFEALGRHGNRPAHIHFLVSSRGMRTLTTQVNIPGDTFIDDDFAFATRDGLIVELEPNTAPTGYESLGVKEPFTRVRFDFVMQQAAELSESKPQARMARALD
ncbi:MULTISPECIES: dioxygenase [Comamonas]|uniref:Putative catechol dioxygenase n=1 Tax=Comamonas testosteroni CNB-1 TaxID=543891 RepID=A7K7K3_COMTE|nr:MULTISPECIES: dioxygenase [Comamonas]ABM06227.1 putative catechol dioxygenase [Comamonas testosteroni CNB-1]MDO1476738.1 catechol 1,2-dioxygenase [Comamonas thiooxydans]